MLGTFNRNALQLNAAEEVSRIVEGLRRNVHEKLHLQGAVLGLSGGIDSSTVLPLCVRAFGAQRVAAILLPEKESSSDSVALARMVADRYGVETQVEDITAALEGAGCYRRRDEAIKRVFPEFAAEWKAKIVLPGNLLEKESMNIFTLTVTSPDGRLFSKRLPLPEFRQIVAASNFKQRTRMAMLYYHAELRNYAVVGTANRNEHDQGFFVKHGDGGVDVAPIIHLLKTQVYQLSRYLEVPKEIQERTPTSDTYSGGSTQEEFFFRVPFEIMDLIWHGAEKGIPAAEIAEAMGLSCEQVQRVIADIVRKQRTTEYLRMPALNC